MNLLIIYALVWCSGKPDLVMTEPSKRTQVDPSGQPRRTLVASPGEQPSRPTEVLKALTNLPAISALDRAMLLKSTCEDSAASRKAQRADREEVRRATALAKAAEEKRAVEEAHQGTKRARKSKEVEAEGGERRLKPNGMRATNKQPVTGSHVREAAARTTAGGRVSKKRRNFD